MSMQKVVESLERKAAEEEKRRRPEFTTAIYSSLFDKATTYTSIVTGAGYVAFFSIWDKTKDYLTKEQALWSALLVTLSLIIFVSWEIFKMIWTSTKLSYTLKDMQNMPAERFHIISQDYVEAQQKKNITLMHWWHIVLILTILPVILAIPILLSGFFRLLLES